MAEPTWKTRPIKVDGGSTISLFLRGVSLHSPFATVANPPSSTSSLLPSDQRSYRGTEESKRSLCVSFLNLSRSLHRSMMFIRESYVNGSPTSLHHFSSQRDVTYSCGYCGYELKLSSSNRITTNIGSNYSKSIKKGVVSFFSIDESRFSQNDELRCLPYFRSKNSWGFFRRSTKLLCRQCGSYIGCAYDVESSLTGMENFDSSSAGGVTSCKKYKIRINALQPSSDESRTPLII